MEKQKNASLTSGELSKMYIEALRAERAGGELTDEAAMKEIRTIFKELIDVYTSYSDVLTPAERRRLVSAKVRNHGFIEVCYEKAQEMPEFLPPYLPLTKFRDDYTNFENKQAVYDLAKRFYELADDTLMVASDLVFRDALAFYNTIKEAVRQKVPGAKALFEELSPYFKRSSYKKDEPTESEVERDVRSLLHGTKEGRVVVENVRPTVRAGERKVIDETHKEHIAAKDTFDVEEKE